MIETIQVAPFVDLKGSETDSAFGLNLSYKNFSDPKSHRMILSSDELEVMAGTHDVIPAELQNKEAVLEAILISEKPLGYEKRLAVLGLVSQGPGKVQLFINRRVCLEQVRILIGEGSWEAVDNSRAGQCLIEPGQTPNVQLSRGDGGISVVRNP